MSYSRTCNKCGVCLYEYECELLDDMCPKCYNKYFEGNGCKKSAEILREYYRREFDKELNK